MPELPQIGDLIGDGAGEGVVGEIENDEIGGIVEMERDRLREIVECEAESPERVEEAEFGGDVAGEALVGEGELGDSVASADDSGPVAWG